MKLGRASWVVMSVISGVLAGTAAAGPQPGAALNFFEGTPHNGLSSRSFRLNALTSNRNALDMLLHRALDKDLLSDAYIVGQLKDPAARAMMVDLVKCALDGQTLVVSEDQNHAPLAKWRGELGLCQPEANTGDPSVPLWDASGPNVPCQQIVTACLMSRVNALKKSIPLSMRSESSALYALHDQVFADRKFRESPPIQDPSLGWPIQSLGGPPCQGPECAWAPAFVGTCTPGEPITLAISDGAACGSATLRVCAGVHGCYSPSTSYPLPPGFPTAPDPFYSAFSAEKAGACAATPLTFTCPTALATRGYYSAMVLPAAPGPVVDGWADGGLHGTVVKLSGSGRYPSPEADVFAFVEGAFYGNLFEPSNLRRSCEVSSDGTKLECSAGEAGSPRIDTCSIPVAGSAPPTGIAGVPGDGERDACLRRDPSIPYMHVYACYSYEQQAENATDDEVSTATFNARLCDLPSGSGTQCFPTVPKRCHYRSGSNQGAGCDAIGPDGAYGHCPGQGTDSMIYQYIITTYLNDACDLIGDRGLCDTLRRTTPSTQRPAGVPGVTHRPHGCGCSADADPADVVSLLLAALVAAGALRLPARWRRAEARA